MGGEKSDKAAGKKGRRRIVLLILLILVVAILGAAFKLKIIRLPECHPAIQEEVDWPPDEPGIYEEASHNRLRTLEKAGFSPPGTVALCNVEGAPAAQAVAHVPTSPRFLVLDPDQTGWEYHVYHSVEVPETQNCLRVRNANRLDAVVTPDADNPQMVWVELPNELDPEQTYMITAGGDAVRGVIMTSAAPPE